MTYIWINPVAEGMYEPKQLTAFLQKHGYEQVKVTGDWLNIVKEKYGALVNTSDRPVIDMRCPKTKQVLDEMGGTSKFTVPEIEPILIHCAREISAREDLQGEEKIITTPCQALADMGNALQLPDTTFIPWNQFLAMLNAQPISNDESLTMQQLQESPIPPGFFEDLELKTVSLTGEEEIRKYFQNHKLQETTKDIQLMELLFCQHGCHNGDGIIATDTPKIRKCES